MNTNNNKRMDIGPKPGDVPGLKLDIEPRRDGKRSPRVELDGWPELDRWANVHSSVWHDITQRTFYDTDYRLLSREDRLRLLAWRLLVQNLELGELLSEAWEKRSSSYVITMGEQTDEPEQK